MDTKRVFVIFSEHVDGAEEMLNRLHKLDREDVINIVSAATIVKEMDGSIYIDDEDDVQGGEGTFAGAIAGGIVGALVGGIPGAIVGTGVGAVTGGTTASLVDMGIDKNVLNNVAAELKPNSSALVAIVENDMADTFEDTVVDEFGNSVKRFYYDVRDEAVEQWHNAKTTLNDAMD